MDKRICHLKFSEYFIFMIYQAAKIEGGHAHIKVYQLIVAASGSFDVLLNDGINKKIITLNRPYFALLVVPGIWSELMEFSSGAICLVLASHKYDESDYIRKINDFKKYATS